VVFTAKPIKAKFVSEYLIKNEYSCSNLLDEKINTESRIFVTNDYKTVRQKLDPQNINLIINFDVPINVKRFLQNSGCTGHFGILGASITLCTKKELEFIREISEKLNVSLTPVPREMTPEYFYYIENPNNVNVSSLKEYINEHVIPNTESKGLPPIFKTPVIPDVNYLISTEKSKIDLSRDAIQDLLYDQGNDEVDWFEKEQISFTKERPKNLTPDQIIELKHLYKEKLNLPYPVQPLIRMMETESWSHPSTNNVTSRLKLWRQSVYKLSKSKTDDKTTKTNSKESSTQEREEKKEEIKTTSIKNSKKKLTTYKKLKYQ